ncbi:DUF6449 domain-containing protein [Priestia koreensis]|uniref:DUF6449 domain-containing protein n=1 Tax=Priestia koreensis TaxID=284581 RepID=UPI0034593ED1
MRSKLFSFNRGIFIQDLRSVGWISIVYFLTLLFTGPLDLYNIITEENFIEEKSQSLFDLSRDIYTIAIFTVPVLLGLLLFRYMQTKLSADYIHSLPIKRESLYNQRIITGVVLLILPVFLTGIVFYVIGVNYKLMYITTPAHIWSWIGLTILFLLFVFMATVFVGIFTGITMVQGALTYILFLLPVGITSIVAINAASLIKGIALDYYLDGTLTRDALPFARVGLLGQGTVSPTVLITYSSLVVIFYVIGLIAYKKRAIEMSSRAISFQFFQPVFKYGVMACFTLLGGAYFGLSQNNKLGWFLFGYVIGSIVGYVVAEVVLQKTWRIGFRWKGYVGFAVVAALFFAIISLDILGIEKKVPDLKNVKKVYVGEDLYTLKAIDNGDEAIGDDRSMVAYTDPTILKHIEQLHKKLIKEASLQRGHGVFDTIGIAYELKGGGRIVRLYNIPRHLFDEDMKPLVDSREYKEKMYPVYALSDKSISTIRSIEIQSNLVEKRPVYITERTKIEEFVHLLQEEIQKQKATDVLTDKVDLSSINISITDRNQLPMTLEVYYKEIEKWLQKEGLADQALTTAADFESATILPKYDQDVRESSYNMSRAEFNEYLAEQPKVKTTRDEKQIQKLLENSEYDVYDGRDYQTIVFLPKKAGQTIQVYDVPKESMKKLIK